MRRMRNINRLKIFHRYLKICPSMTEVYIIMQLDGNTDG